VRTKYTLPHIVNPTAVAAISESSDVESLNELLWEGEVVFT
jgi:hypothetical protein